MGNCDYCANIGLTPACPLCGEVRHLPPVTDSLPHKLQVLERLAQLARLPPALVADAKKRMARGHKDHGDAGHCDVRAEAWRKTVDLANYAALAVMRGDRRVGWWVVVVLAGLAGRVLLWLDGRGRASVSVR